MCPRDGVAIAPYVFPFFLRDFLGFCVFNLSCRAGSTTSTVFSKEQSPAVKSYIDCDLVTKIACLFPRRSALGAGLLDNSREVKSGPFYCCLQVVK